MSRYCVAVISTADTKKDEMLFLKNFIESLGVDALTIDISTKANNLPEADIPPSKVLQAGGFSADALVNAGSKAEAIRIMTLSISALLDKIHKDRRMQGVLGFGGLQNTLMASTAMQRLPFGFPKVLLSTVATGPRTVGSLIGIKDVVMVPSIADIAGVNVITKMSLKAAASAIVGMVKNSDGELKIEQKFVAATMMGVNNDGIVRAVHQAQENGFEVVTFHSTGVGGAAMEQLIREGAVAAVMDLSLHEIVSEDVFGAGFARGAKNRLSAAAETGIPMVVCPGGMDFVDFTKQDFLSGAAGAPDKRKFTLHNANTVHIKLTKEEGQRAAGIMAERLNHAVGDVIVILPLKGLRSETRPGEKLYDPEVDEAIFDTLRSRLDRNIRIIELDCHIDDMEFSSTVVRCLCKLTRRHYDESI